MYGYGGFTAWAKGTVLGDKWKKAQEEEEEEDKKTRKSSDDLKKLE